MTLQADHIWSGPDSLPAQMPGSAQPWLLTSEKKDSATIAESTVRPPTQVIWLAPSTVPSSDSAQGANGCAAHHDLFQAAYRIRVFRYSGTI